MAATQVSFAPHVVVATPVVGHAAHCWPQASWPVEHVKGWQARFVMLPDVSHFAMLQNPEQFNRALLDFLAA